MKNTLNVIELESLNQFRSDLFQSRSPQEIEKKLDWYINAGFAPLSTEFGGDIRIIRARRCSNEFGYENINALYFPPGEISNNGRLNDRGNPVIYASFHIDTALTEIGAKKGEFIHIAEFVVSRSEKIH